MTSRKGDLVITIDPTRTRGTSLRIVVEAKDRPMPLGRMTKESQLIATYALCGFANFSSIAIQIGGIGGLAPNRRADLARFGLRAVLGGSIATFMTATIAGVLEQL